MHRQPQSADEPLWDEPKVTPATRSDRYTPSADDEAWYVQASAAGAFRPMAPATKPKPRSLWGGPNPLGRRGRR